jgi:transketolase
MRGKTFHAEKLGAGSLRRLSKLARGGMLKMTPLAGSGHPGGSMSSIDFYLVLYSHANVHPQFPSDPDRDRIVISHGHTSSGVYAALGRIGFFPIEATAATFRKMGSSFEGHVEKGIQGVKWSTSNLGQRLSAGCGEQRKGQISEARRFAIKYGLDNLMLITDFNCRQINGDRDPEWGAWRLIEYGYPHFRYGWGSD